MVSKASEDWPEPERPVKTTSLSRGIVRSTFFRLCSRAPRTTMARPPNSFSTGVGRSDRLEVLTLAMAAFTKFDANRAEGLGPRFRLGQNKNGTKLRGPCLFSARPAAAKLEGCGQVAIGVYPFSRSREKVA